VELLEGNARTGSTTGETFSTTTSKFGSALFSKATL
jgi:hypothetical protein